MILQHVSSKKAYRTYRPQTDLKTVNSYQCACKQERVDYFVLFEETSGRVDKQALEEVILDVHQTFVQLLRLVGNVDRT